MGNIHKWKGCNWIGQATCRPWQKMGLHQCSWAKSLGCLSHLVVSWGNPILELFLEWQLWKIKNEALVWCWGFRWMQLKQFFKVSSPEEDAQHKTDKLHKVRDLWEDFISRCKINFWPAQQVGIDEAIKKFKGRCSFKQYIQSKPVCWGLKIFCVLLHHWISLECHYLCGKEWDWRW